MLAVTRVVQMVEKLVGKLVESTAELWAEKKAGQMAV